MITWHPKKHSQLIIDYPRNSEPATSKCLINCSYQPGSVSRIFSPGNALLEKLVFQSRLQRKAIYNNFSTVKKLPPGKVGFPSKFYILSIFACFVKQFIIIFQQLKNLFYWGVFYFITSLSVCVRRLLFIFQRHAIPTLSGWSVARFGFGRRSCLPTFSSRHRLRWYRTKMLRDTHRVTVKRHLHQVADKSGSNCNYDADLGR